MKIIFSLLLLSASFSFSAFSQNRLDNRILQYYGNYVSQLSTEQISWLNNCLSRVHILTTEQVSLPASELRLLSTVQLQSKFGEQNTMPAFDPATFNALQYSFNFFKKEDQYISVDGTSFVIKISKKEN